MREKKGEPEAGFSADTRYVVQVTARIARLLALAQGGSMTARFPDTRPIQANGDVGG